MARGLLAGVDSRLTPSRRSEASQLDTRDIAEAVPILKKENQLRVQSRGEVPFPAPAPRAVGRIPPYDDSCLAESSIKG